MLSLSASTSPEIACPPRRMRPRDLSDHREIAHQSRLATVIDSRVGGNSPMPSGHEAATQIVLPYAGLFAYSIGRQKWLIDSSNILLIRPGWDFTDEQPVPGLGHASLLINPNQAVFDEIIGSRAGSAHVGTLFGGARSSPEIWLATQSFLAATGRGSAPLQTDEWVINVLQLATGRPAIRLRACARTVDRAKAYLHAHAHERVSLHRIARAVGVSPVYLTQEFARSEGVPLYQYQLQLRLIDALRRLRDCDDITDLALELGFSSHSHFSAAFKRTVGRSPSDIRESLRSKGSSLPLWKGRRPS